jgi:hypothetical protein
VSAAQKAVSAPAWLYKWSRLAHFQFAFGVRLSDIEPHFTCTRCGKRGADVRPDFSWSRSARQQGDGVMAASVGGPFQA